MKLVSGSQFISDKKGGRLKKWRLVITADSEYTWNTRPTSSCFRGRTFSNLLTAANFCHFHKRAPFLTEINREFSLMVHALEYGEIG